MRFGQHEEVADENLGPGIPGSGAPPDDGFTFCCVDGVQAQSRRLKVGHGQHRSSP